jgi:spore maturation protein SpmA
MCDVYSSSGINKINRNKSRTNVQQTRFIVLKTTIVLLVNNTPTTSQQNTSVDTSAQLMLNDCFTGFHCSLKAAEQISLRRIKFEKCALLVAQSTAISC